jgi:ADP-ribose pyrophosphatase
MIESLCEHCIHRREIVSGRGSRFLLCRMSQKDRRFHKYPPQPIVQCSGHEPLRQHGPWRIVDSQDIYRDAWVELRKDEVIRPDGQPGTYAVVNLKPGVCVLAMDDEHNVYLTEEFHYGVGRVTIEAVSGGMEPDEDALLTAQRELQEELGIRARDWTDMGTLDPFTASVVSPTRLYLARDLKFGDHAQEGTETIACVQMPFADAVQKAVDSEITHGPSCVLLMKVHLMLAKESVESS